MSGKSSAASSELVAYSSEYVQRGSNLYSNFKEALSKGEIDKASEMLWGVFSCYVNAYAILITGKPFTQHGPTVDFVLQFAKGRRDGRLIRAAKLADRAHANFYHGFLKDEDDLRPVFQDVLYAAKVFDKEVRSFLRKATTA